MSFLGADTDELREAGQKCQEGKEATDDVINYLRALIIVLKAASFFTGGASAAYAQYLETTVVPWLQRISQALGLMAQVLMSNAQAQDDVSDGRTVDFATLPTYTGTNIAMPSQPITPWEGTLVPEQRSYTPLATGSETGAGGFAPYDASTGADTPEVETPTLSTGSIGGGSLGTPGDSTFGDSSLGNSTFGDTTLGGRTPGESAFGDSGFGDSAFDNSAFGDSAFGDWASGATPAETFTAGAPGGAGSDPAGVVGGASAGGSGGGSDAGGLGSSTIGGGGLDAAAEDDGVLTSYSTDGAELGGTTPDSGAQHGEAELGGGAETLAPTAEQESYGAAAAIAGGAAAFGLGGAALAARTSGGNDDRIDELGVQNGRGSRGEDVRELQERLTRAGYDAGGADGRWGPDTQAAYDAYRQDHPMDIQHGEGFAAPSGFDYQQITGVRDNPNVTPAFLREVEGVAQRIGAKPEHLMGVMSFETGGEFGADTPTGAKGGTAVGLIQFTGVARQDLGVTRDQLIAMTPTQQLEYVEQYFDSRRGPHLGTVEGLYSAVLGGTGSTDLDRVQISRGDAGWAGNKGLDADGDGHITVREGASRIQRALSGR